VAQQSVEGREQVRQPIRTPDFGIGQIGPKNKPVDPLYFFGKKEQVLHLHLLMGFPEEGIIKPYLSIEIVQTCAFKIGINRERGKRGRIGIKPTKCRKIGIGNIGRKTKCRKNTAQINLSLKIEHQIITRYRKIPIESLAF